MTVTDEDMAMLMLRSRNSDLGIRYYDACAVNKLYAAGVRYITQTSSASRFRTLPTVRTAAGHDSP